MGIPFSVMPETFFMNGEDWVYIVSIHLWPLGYNQSSLTSVRFSIPFEDWFLLEQINSYSKCFNNHHF